MDTIRILNLAISLTGIVLCSIGVLHLMLGKKIHERMVDYMLPTYVCLIIFAASNLAGQLMRGQPGDLNRVGLYISNFLEFMSPALATYIMSQYLLAIVDPQKKWKAVRVVLLVPVLIYTTLLIVTQFTGFYYIIDADNFYQRSAWFPLSQALIAVLLVTDIILLFRDKAVLTQKEAVAFSIYFMIPLITAIIQAFVYGIYLNILATIIAAFAMHVFLFTERTEQYYRQIEENARQKEENAKLKVEIMLSQIQPHFLYNALTAIQELCHSNPPQAEIATRNFSNYLRGNMRSIKSTGAIAFTEELRHTQGYLELEKLRFEDSLQICYDIQCTSFALPSLSLQPIAENAVKHGVRGNRDGVGTVTIATREYADRYEVIVTDDGPGFNSSKPPVDQNRPHIGIQNVRERLARLCGGTLRIDSVIGQGTVATIILPKREEQEQTV